MPVNPNLAYTRSHLSRGYFSYSYGPYAQVEIAQTGSVTFYLVNRVSGTLSM